MKGIRQHFVNSPICKSVPTTIKQAFYSMPQLKPTDSAIDFAGTQKNLFISPIQVFALKMRKHIFSSSL